MMKNIFSVHYQGDSKDNDLVKSAKQGGRTVLEELIKRHQTWIYNIVLRMVGNPHDVEDVTQEILVKMLIRLSTFKEKSSFRTWLYRIVANHVINMKTLSWEHFFTSYDAFTSIIDEMPQMDLPDVQNLVVDVNLLVEETKIGCLSGMLLCLNRTQRLVIILGSIFSVNSSLGGEIMNISPDNFRQKLVRARKQLSNFMNDRCGLINKENSCSCARKTRAAIAAGYVVPDNLRFHTEYVQRINAFASESTHIVDDALDFQGHFYAICNCCKCCCF